MKKVMGISVAKIAEFRQEVMQDEMYVTPGRLAARLREAGIVVQKCQKTGELFITADNLFSIVAKIMAYAKTVSPAWYKKTHYGAVVACWKRYILTKALTTDAHQYFYQDTSRKSKPKEGITKLAA